MNYPAIETVGRATLIVRGNEVIGECKVVTMRGSDIANVQMQDKAAKDLIATTLAVKIMDDKTDWVTVGFFPLTGLYLNTNFNGPEAEELDKIFEDTRIVDKLNLSYGMVPDTFKDIPGYRSAFKETESS